MKVVDQSSPPTSPDPAPCAGTPPNPPAHTHTGTSTARGGRNPRKPLPHTFRHTIHTHAHKTRHKHIHSHKYSQSHTLGGPEAPRTRRLWRRKTGAEGAAHHRGPGGGGRSGVVHGARHAAGGAVAGSQAGKVQAGPRARHRACRGAAAAAGDCRAQPADAASGEVSTGTGKQASHSRRQRGSITVTHLPANVAGTAALPVQQPRQQGQQQDQPPTPAPVPLQPPPHAPPPAADVVGAPGGARFLLPV